MGGPKTRLKASTIQRLCSNPSMFSGEEDPGRLRARDTGTTVEKPATKARIFFG